MTYLQSLLRDEQGRKDLLVEIQERQSRNEKQTAMIARLNEELSKEIEEREDYGRESRLATRNAIVYAERAAALLEERERPCAWSFGTDTNAPDCWVSGCGNYLSPMDEILPNWDAPKPIYCPGCGHPIQPDQDTIAAYEQWQPAYKPRKPRRAAPGPAQEPTP